MDFEREGGKNLTPVSPPELIGGPPTFFGKVFRPPTYLPQFNPNLKD